MQTDFVDKAFNRDQSFSVTARHDIGDYLRNENLPIVGSESLMHTHHGDFQSPFKRVNNDSSVMNTINQHTTFHGRVGSVNKLNDD